MNDFRDIMGVGGSFMRVRVLLTACELDLFTLIHENPCAVDIPAGRLNLDKRALTRLLDCAIALGLLEKESGVYRVTETGALYSSRHPESVLPMALHMNRLWDSWGGLTDIVKDGPHPERKPGLSMSEESRKAFIGAMHVVGRKLSLEVAEACEPGRFKRLLDIGGGSGTYTIAFLSRNPEMTAILFDLDNVIPWARERLSEAGLLDRVELETGDFYHDELPKGADLALLSAIIHQNSPGENLGLYRKIHRALAPGGRVIIRDHIMDEARVHPPSGALNAINMLVNTRGGDTYTFGEVKEALEEAGFVDVRLLRAGERMDGLVEAVKLS